MSEALDRAMQEAALTRGGSRQRLQAAHSTLFLDGSGTEARKSETAQRLLLLFGWGLLSANQVRWIAEGVVIDGLEMEEVSDLSNLGTAGKHKGNVRRDLITKWCKKLQVPKPVQIVMPIVDKLKIDLDHMHPIINPMELTESIYQNFPSLFPDLFGTRNLRSFWDQAQQT